MNKTSNEFKEVKLYLSWKSTYKIVPKRHGCRINELNGKMIVNYDR